MEPMGEEQIEHTACRGGSTSEGCLIELREESKKEKVIWKAVGSYLSQPLNQESDDGVKKKSWRPGVPQQKR